MTRLEVAASLLGPFIQIMDDEDTTLVAVTLALRYADLLIEQERLTRLPVPSPPVTPASP